MDESDHHALPVCHSAQPAFADAAFHSLQGRMLNNARPSWGLDGLLNWNQRIVKEECVSSGPAPAARVAVTSTCGLAKG